MQEQMDIFKTYSGEQDFYVLKFPSKLWKILHDCRSGAIGWSAFGKTIHINYSLFSQEFLECPVPKFKTRNMTSFVRQLNMYGFKKIQQPHNKFSRYYHIHEFYHEFFQCGRPDLLCNVKRRAMPIRYPRILNEKTPSRLDFCRNTFEESLVQSNEFKHFWKLSPQLCASNGEGNKVIKPAYRIRIIPAQDIEISGDTNELTAVILRDYEKVLSKDPADSIDEPPESDDESYENDATEPLVFETPDLSQVTPQQFAVLSSIMNNIPVQIKNGFDGSNYIIDVVGSVPKQDPDFDPLYIPSEDAAVDDATIRADEPSYVPEEEATAPTIHLPEDEDLFACLSSAITGVE